MPKSRHLPFPCRSWQSNTTRCNCILLMNIAAATNWANSDKKQQTRCRMNTHVSMKYEALTIPHSINSNNVNCAIALWKSMLVQLLCQPAADSLRNPGEAVLRNACEQTWRSGGARICLRTPLLCRTCGLLWCRNLTVRLRKRDATQAFGLF